jgi:hypothetical protein
LATFCETTLIAAWVALNPDVAVQSASKLTVGRLS